MQSSHNKLNEIPTAIDKLFATILDTIDNVFINLKALKVDSSDMAKLILIKTYFQQSHSLLKIFKTEIANAEPMLGIELIAVAHQRLSELNNKNRILHHLFNDLNDASMKQYAYRIATQTTAPQTAGPAQSQNYNPRLHRSQPAASGKTAELETPVASTGCCSIQ
jgi:hypothetical protein